MARLAIQLATILVVSLMQLLRTSAAIASTDCPSQVGVADASSPEELYLQEHLALLAEDLAEESGALSLVQKRAVGHVATKQPRSKAGVTRKSSYSEAYAPRSLDGSPRNAMMKELSHGAAPVSQTAGLGSSDAIIGMMSNSTDAKLHKMDDSHKDVEAANRIRVAPAPQKLQTTLSQEMALHTSADLLENSSQTLILGFSARNSVILILIIALVYCCVLADYIPDCIWWFSTLGLLPGDDDMHDYPTRYYSTSSAAASLLAGSTKPQSAEASSSKSSQAEEALPPSSSKITRQVSPSAFGHPSTVGCPSSLCPTVMLQPTQRLLLPVGISDCQQRGPFEIIWSEDDPSSSPCFSLLVHESAGQDPDTLELFDPWAGNSKWLFESPRGGHRPCASVGPARGEGRGYYIIDNKHVKSQSRGLSYRRLKDLGDKMTSHADGVPWGSVVIGSDEGDGWLKVGEKYLPMVVNGVEVIFPTQSAAGEDTTSSICIFDDRAQPYASIKASSDGTYTVQQRGLEVMTLKTSNPEFHVEVIVGTTRFGGMLHQGTKLAGKDYMELSVEPGADPVLVLMCSLAVVRKLVT